MSELRPLPFSERCRALAQECLTKAQLFRNEKPRLQMLLFAVDYARKALQAERIEATIQTIPDEGPSLIPEIAEAFVSRLKNISLVPPSPPKQARARRPAKKKLRKAPRKRSTGRKRSADDAAQRPLPT
jgi:hypothetical protein